MSNASIHCHALSGCSPTPLAHYLKALGILRLVAEQKDPAARGWWRNDVFHLATTMDRGELTRFFNDEYIPTPMTAPWLPRSGYSAASSHRKTREVLEQIIENPAARFQPFREVKRLMEVCAEDKGMETSDGSALRIEKFVQAARVSAPSSVVSWIDACVVFREDKPTYPAIFGTGGNEGSGSYLANYYVALVATLIHRTGSIEHALWNDFYMNDELQRYLNQQSFNAGHFSAASRNDCPWSYILCLEGILTMAARLTRRISETLASPVRGTGASVASPFAMGNSCADYPTASKTDSKSRQSGSLISGRGEQWFPVWTRPSTLGELTNLFRTSRVTVSSGQKSIASFAKRSSDFARAIARAGTVRGISSFERIAYLQRNGDNHMAVPLGRFEVNVRANADLLDEVAPWLDRLGSLASSKKPPAPESFDRVHRACENALVACTRSDDPSGYLSLLVSLAKAEDQMVQSPKFVAEKRGRPLPPLSRRWLHIVEEAECSAELRLACALAAQHGRLEPKEASRSVRIHWLPLDGHYFAKGESGLNIGPEQASIGLDLERALISLMNRRMLAVAKGVSGASRDTKSSDRSHRFVPLALSHPSLGARLEDIEAFLEYRVNDAKLLAIARGLMAVDMRRFEPNEGNAADDQHRPLGGLATYGLLRLATPVGAIRLPNQADKHVRCNPLVYRRLQNGNLTGAIDIARQQLVAAGLRPRIQLGIGSPQFARRLAASMAFGVAPFTTTRLALGLTQPKLTREERLELEAVTEPT